MSFTGILVIQPLWKSATKEAKYRLEIPAVFKRITHSMASEYLAGAGEEGPVQNFELPNGMDLLSATQLQRSTVEFLVDNQGQPDLVKKLNNIWRPASGFPVDYMSAPVALYCQKPQKPAADSSSSDASAHSKSKPSSGSSDKPVLIGAGIIQSWDQTVIRDVQSHEWAQIRLVLMDLRLETDFLRAINYELLG